MPPKVWLAISSFRSDDSVSVLLEKAAGLVPSVFSHVLVVDSLGTPRIPELIAQRGWSWVSYHSASSNLGSAGNLAQRLELAASADADYVYALNHDGALEESTVKALVAGARSVEQLGAAYPLRVYPNRGGRYDITGMSRLLLPTRTSGSPPGTGLLDVYWGSSNGTLYALAPVRSGLKPWGDLWMGWEDLGYGWLLHAHGYRQVIVRDAIFQDSYEFQNLKAAGRRPVYVSGKAPWYAYYVTRNLILINRRLQLGWDVQASIGCRIAIEWGTTALLRPQKRERMALMARGMLDGLRGRGGKYANEG